MSKLKNKLLVLLAVLGAAKLAYAAVVPISQTPFSSSYGLRSAASGSDTQHTSTYSGVTCNSDAVASTDACTAKCVSELGVSDAVGTATACDGGKYNCTCSCPSDYSELCTADDQAPTNPSEHCNGKWKSCRNVSNLSTCSAVEEAYDGVGFLTDSDTGCANIGISTSFDISLIKDVSCRDKDDEDENGLPKEKHFCAMVLCETLVNNTATEIKTIADSSNGTISANTTIYNKKDDGGSARTPISDNIITFNADYLAQTNGASTKGNYYCWAGNSTIAQIAVCDGSFSTTTAPTTCSSGTTPDTCEVNKTPKYNNKCTYTQCEQTDALIVNAVGYASGSSWQPGKGNLSCPSSGYMAGVSKHFCALPNTTASSQNEAYNICACSSDYTITAACNNDSEKVPVVTVNTGTYYANSTASSSSMTYFDFCVWDAQTALNTQSGAMQTMDINKIKYKKCLPKCPDDATTLYEAGDASVTCGDGSQKTACAKEIDSSIVNSSINSGNSSADIGKVFAPLKGQIFYKEMQYCGCPSSYKICKSGEVAGGKSCTSNGNTYHEYCLAQCSEEAPKALADKKGVCNNGDVDIIQENFVGDWTCTDKDGVSLVCSNANVTQCCSSGDCTSNFVFAPTIGEKACFPINSKTSSNICLKSPSDTSTENRNGYWQCSCPSSYKTEAECTASGSENQSLGAVCLFEGTKDAPVEKRAFCGYECPDENENTIVRQAELSTCKIGTYDPITTQCFKATEGSTSVDDDLRYVCQCPTDLQSKLTFCINKVRTDGQGTIRIDETATKTSQIDTCKNYSYDKDGKSYSPCKDCLNHYVNIGSISCDLEARVDGKTNSALIKSTSFALSCSGAREERGTALVIKTNADDCKISGYTLYDVCYQDKTPQYICKCPGEYQTLDEFCRNRTSSEAEYKECMNTYVGAGTACTFDIGDGNVALKKFADFEKKCSTASNVPLFESPEACIIGSYDVRAEVCYDPENTGVMKYTCQCPDGFRSIAEGCEDENKILGGTSCNLEGIDTSSIKYETCLPKCNNTAETPVVDSPDKCPNVGELSALTSENDKCFRSIGSPTASYICRCPNGFQTLAGFCEKQAGSSTSDAYKECMNIYIGVGTVCTFDGPDVHGQLVRKYQEFKPVCPADRPLFYTADECAIGNNYNLFDYVCYERDNLMQQRVVCKCPTSWVDASGNSTDSDGNSTHVCADNEEPSGTICSFDGQTKIKYEKCYIKCDNVETNGGGIRYLEDEEATASECKNLLGDGGVFGVDSNGSQCSRANSLYSPCYCGTSHSYTCTDNNNEQPADDATTCTIGGTTYYNQCQNNSCSEESSTIAIIDMGTHTDAVALCQERFGIGAGGKKCGNNKAECSCNSSTYTDTCDYPYNPPSGTKGDDYCIYGDGSTLMRSGREHYKTGQCSIMPTMAICGQNVFDNGLKTSSDGYSIFVTETESACKSRYGQAAKAQICEYNDDSDRRAFNCYYQAAEYVYDDTNCEVRHVLGDDYIIVNGKRKYKTCDCHAAYKYHKYNCAGILSGGSCKQTVTAAMKAEYPDMAGRNTISMYPYCQCPADYNQVCDGERYIGVGTACNGKYTACECKKDNLPENWADNYYGCPGGKKPTGVTKSDGCGGKYYQCEVSSCTWQHTEKCPSPLIGVDGCQDNLGNVGGYKSCRCPDNYKICSDGQVGIGEPCALNGAYYYQKCAESATCAHGETNTCQGELLIGINSCTRNGITYFERCACVSGYDKLCGDGEVGVGSFCKLNGKEYFTSCAKPSNTCTDGHKEVCDTNQEKSDPCVNSDNKVMYKCKCPSNWHSCDGGSPAEGSEACTDSDGKTVYSQCLVEGVCSTNQEKTYKTCTASQTGGGGSCTSSDGTVKYAECEETTACRLNGYQYACSGYDQESLGDDYCIDANGNKLYKECKCPSTWITCPSKNNQKGRFCTPINGSGVSQATVYESCGCDDTVYKYTCKADTSASGNVGIIVPSDKKSCTPRTYDSKTKSVKEGDTLYESCECDAAYKYTCTNNGQIATEGYCQKTPNGDKLYAGCTCDDAKFPETSCKSSDNNGLTAPTDASKICTPVGNIDASEKGTRYAECVCGANYTLKCDSYSDASKYAQNNDYCIDPSSGEKLYRSCTCDASQYSESCVASGGNKGLMGATTNAESCTTLKSVNGTTGSTKMFSGCSCKSNYKYSCNSKDDDGTSNEYTNNYVDLNDYCKTKKIQTDGETTTSINYVRYRQCKCPDNYKVCADGKEGSGDYCLEVSETGVATKKYLDENCVCVPKTIDSTYIASVYTAKSDDELATISKNSAFQEEVKKACGDSNNLADVITDGCGKVYFKCLIDTSTYAYSEESCKAMTPSGSASWVGSDSSGVKTNYYGSAFQMYKTCGCSGSGYRFTSCSDEMVKTDGRCINTGKGKGVTKVSCDTHASNALIPSGGYCQDSSGTKYYQYCACNSAVYTYKSGTSSKNNCFNGGDDNKLNSEVHACQAQEKHGECPDCKTCSEEGSASAKWMSY